MARKVKSQKEGIPSGGGRWDMGGISRGPNYAEGFITPLDYTMGEFGKYFEAPFLAPESTPGFTVESNFSQGGPSGGFSGGRKRRR